MKEAARFAEAARSFEGIPFVVHGRDPKIGVDCAGLVIASLRLIGLHPDDVDYALVPHGDLVGLVERLLATAFDQISLEWEPGDVLLLRYRVMGMYNHIGIYLGNGQMAHAWDHGPARGVRITPIDHGLQKKVQSVWRLR